MPNRTYRITEIVGTSDRGIDDAIRNGVASASEAVHRLNWFEVVEVRGHIHEGQVSHFQVTMKVGYRIDE